MRPKILFPLFADVSTLSGIGSQMRKRLESLVGVRIIDLLWHKPVSIVDRRQMPPLNHVKEGNVITTIVTVDKHIKGYAKRRRPYEVQCSNESGFITLTFFNAHQDYLNKTLPMGHKRVISGKVERYGGQLRMPHPDYIVKETELEQVQRIEPVYPLTQGLSSKVLIRAIEHSLTTIPDLPEWIDSDYLEKQQWQSWKEHMVALHHPEFTDDLNSQSPIHSRLAYDELLANQLALAIMRKRNQAQEGKVIKGNTVLQQKLEQALPFKLMQGQKNVIKEILSDMQQPSRMIRLLQGDVGSGKTIVAIMAILNTIEANKQAAFMAPTEILARQHYNWVIDIIDKAGLSKEISVAILTSKEKGATREKTIKQLKSGQINLIIGTHALFQEKVTFNDLGLAVIDEQHRFGVRQRLMLTEKGHDVDILLMTATPIPRTLTLTFYGDIEISSLREKPAYRKPIDTRAIPLSRIDEVFAGLDRAFKEGEKIYWICPMIDESENNDMATAQARFSTFNKHFGKAVGLIHGKMKAEEKEEVMQQFIDGDIRILVATTVVEVGVDVSDATIMIIEHAERFGLAQLHQLRGRIGRGNKQSSCILLYDDALSQTSRQRLKVMRETYDGFRIAEEDLDLRGSGEILGTRQSGMPDFKLADISIHRDLLLTARDDAKLIMERDPTLSSTRGIALKNLLYLFEYDSQIKYLYSG